MVDQAKEREIGERTVGSLPVAARSAVSKAENFIVIKYLYGFFTGIM